MANWGYMAQLTDSDPANTAIILNQNLVSYLKTTPLWSTVLDETL